MEPGPWPEASQPPPFQVPSQGSSLRPSRRKYMASLEDEGAVLPVKGEVGDGDGAGGAEDGGWQPVDAAIRRHEHIAVQGHLEHAVHAADRPGHGAARTALTPALRPAWTGPGHSNPSQGPRPCPVPT